MKTYAKPFTSTIRLTLQQQLLQASGNLNLNETVGSGTLQDEEATGPALTRRGGIGSGLWEDMK